MEWPLGLLGGQCCLAVKTMAEGLHGAVGARGPGEIARAQSCREQTRGVLAQVPWRKQHLSCAQPGCISS